MIHSKVWLVLLLLFAFPAMAQEESKAPSPSRPGNNTPGWNDPSENVKALNEAAVKRQDDLRIASEKFVLAQLGAIEKLGVVRDDYIKELLAANEKRADEISRLRAEFYEKINATEKDRVNAIRTVDTGAVAIANERAVAQASALAKTVQDSALVLSAQVTKSADDVRTLVKTTADEQSRNLQQQFAGIQTQFTTFGTRLTALEQAGAEGLGKQKFQDPAIAALLAEVRTLSASRVDLAGQGAGRSDVVGWMAAGFMALLMLGGFVVAFVNMRKQGK